MILAYYPHMDKEWVKSGVCLYRYYPSGTYHARVRFGGKLYRQSLETTDFAFAKRKLTEFKANLGRTDPRQGDTSFAAVLDRYAQTLGHLKPSTHENKLSIIAELKQWPAARLPLRAIRPSDIAAWLSKHSPQERSASHHNARLTLIRDAMQLAIDDRIIVDSPARNLKWRNPPKNVQRPTPTPEQFRTIVSDVRAQQFNRDADDSADFIEFLGLAGLGQAEASSIRRTDVNLKKGTITTFRHKTKSGFQIPIYPQLRPLIKRLCKGKGHDELLLRIKGARKALTESCKRLGLPHFTQRSLRRMFVTQALRRGVNVKAIARWQGHKDGGKLILDTYSDVVEEGHSQAMARLMK
jgi:integrase